MYICKLIKWKNQSSIHRLHTIYLFSFIFCSHMKKQFNEKQYVLKLSLMCSKDLECEEEQEENNTT